MKSGLVIHLFRNASITSRSTTLSRLHQSRINPPRYTESALSTSTSSPATVILRCQQASSQSCFISDHQAKRCYSSAVTSDIETLPDADNVSEEDFEEASDVTDTRRDNGLDPEMGYNTIEKRKGLVRPKHDWLTSKKYMDSKTYTEVYGEGVVVWEKFRRNITGPQIWYKQHDTRLNCVSYTDRKFVSNYPCPVCRDEYLVLDYRNPKLLSQFINTHSGKLFPIKRVGLCKTQYRHLEVEVLRAKNSGYLTFPVPFRNYDYSEYYPWLQDTTVDPVPEEPVRLSSDRPKPLVVYPVHNPEKTGWDEFTPIRYEFEEFVGEHKTKKDHDDDDDDDDEDDNKSDPKQKSS